MLHLASNSKSLLTFDSVSLILATSNCCTPINRFQSKTALLTFNSVSLILATLNCCTPIYRFQSKPALLTFDSVSLILAIYSTFGHLFNPLKLIQHLVTYSILGHLFNIWPLIQPLATYSIDHLFKLPYTYIPTSDLRSQP